MTRAIPPAVMAIASEVASNHGLSLCDILSRKRDRRFSWPRQEVFALVRQRVTIDGAPASYPRIGQWLGYDHTTVLYGERRHLARQEAEAAA